MNVFRLLTLADYEIWEPESRFERRLFVNDEAIFCSARLSYLIFNRYGLGVRHSHCGWAVEKETTRRVEKRRLRQKEEKKKKTKWATSVEKKTITQELGCMWQDTAARPDINDQRELASAHVTEPQGWYPPKSSSIAGGTEIQLPQWTRLSSLGNPITNTSLGYSGLTEGNLSFRIHLY